MIQAISTNALTNALADVDNDSKMLAWDFLAGIELRENSSVYQDKLTQTLSDLNDAAGDAELQGAILDSFAAEMLRAKAYMAIAQLLVEPEQEHATLTN